MKKYLLIFLLTISSKSIAQTYEWTNTYGNDNFDKLISITSDHLGNTYSTGHFVGTVDFDPGPDVFNLTSNETGFELNVFVQKLDPQGNFVWAITFPDVNFDDGRSIAIDSLGNLIIVGRTEIPGMSDNIMIFKLDPDGNVIFFEQFGNNAQDYASSVVLDDQDNIYLIGQYQNTIDMDPGQATFNLSANGSTDIFLLKLDSNGDFLWAKSIGGNDLDLGRHLNIDGIGNLYITGFFNGTCDFDPNSGVSNGISNGIWDAFIVKLNNNGDLIWHKSFGSTGLDDASSSDTDSNGNTIITGFFSGTVDFNPNAGVFNLTSSGEEDIFILKLDPNGELIWANSLGTAYYDYGQSVTLDDVNEIYVTGGLFNPENFDPNGFTTDYDVFINKYNAAGNLLWDLKFGGIDSDLGFAIHVDDFYNIYVGGYFHQTVDFNPEDNVEDIYVSNGLQDIFITKYSQDIEFPIAYPMESLVACDDDMDGFSDSFDTSNIEDVVLNGQTGYELTYFDENGNELPSPLPNPFTNTIANNQYITIRVTDPVTLLFDETIIELQVSVSPEINPPSNIFACDEGGGFSSFDTSAVQDEISGNQTGLEILYFDQNGNELQSPLPNPFQNVIPDLETLTARVYFEGDDSCFSEVSFDLIIKPIPEVFEVDDIYECDDDSDGFEVFDLSEIETNLLGSQANLLLEYYSSDNNIIPINSLNNYTNITPEQDFIFVRVFSDQNDCYFDTTINLIVDDSFPVAHPLDIIFGCDDNNNGVSEYFDTSNVENQVLNGQSGMLVSYFEQNGSELSSPLPNPFTNTELNNQDIIVRVTNPNSNCYTETILELQTITQPNINQPSDLFGCDQGNGFSEFNTSLMETQIIGNQTGLTIQYFDSDNNLIPSPLPTLFQNTEPYNQTIHVRVEDENNPICYSETSFDLIVNNLPEINLEEEYFLCELESSITLTLNSNFDSYNWYTVNDETSISTSNSAEITNEGNYILTVGQFENGILCENSFSFTLTHTNVPEIIEVNHGQIGNTFIEIIVSENGDYEYSIDGINFQNSNYFDNIQGGCYVVYVRDKNDCGEDSKEVVVIDYPKFFTPNNDLYNDYWQIKGITKYPNAEIFIFDRYGKLLTQLFSNSLGWNGTYNGKNMPSNDYWFTADLGDGFVFSGHFTLKR
ncbi:T9SS type B sorting domain-containing protein [Olleya marilimosa]|uniref:T9SS type B sorting domain-containing protein n=1 Tax=Olleya marilimosa TaxID=272164 RepID=UPI0004B61929|nr:T9SS type B sorting domain-containing protein [Olleya marilimosa]